MSKTTEYILLISLTWRNTHLSEVESCCQQKLMNVMYVTLKFYVCLHLILMYVFVFQTLDGTTQVSSGYVKNEGVCTYLKNENGVLVYAGTHYSKDKALLEGLETCTGHRYVICIRMYLTFCVAFSNHNVDIVLHLC